MFQVRKFNFLFSIDLSTTTLFLFWFIRVYIEFYTNFFQIKDKLFKIFHFVFLFLINNLLNVL